MEYYTINKFSKIVGKTAQILRNWDKSGHLKPHHTSTNGYRYYSEEQINKVLKIEGCNKPKIVIGYCRVASTKQKDDLERQISNVSNYLLAQGRPFEIISDVGSGINYNKKGLQKLIQRIESGEVEKVVIIYKDRLIRFGFELIEYIAKLNQCSIEIIDNTEKTQEQELVEDMIQVINLFACRLQGKRASKAKKFIGEVLKDDNINEG